MDEAVGGPAMRLCKETVNPNGFRWFVTHDTKNCMDLMFVSLLLSLSPKDGDMGWAQLNAAHTCVLVIAEEH